MFKRRQKVVKILHGAGCRTASVTEIARAKQGRVQCETDEHLWYDSETGKEIDPAIPGFWSELIVLEA
jgi:hypothetical protein